MALGPNTNYILKKTSYVNSCSAANGMVYASGIGRMFFWGAAEPVAADYPGPGALWLDTDNTLVMHNTGSLASPTWTALTTASSFTLDGAYAADTGERTIAVDGGHVVFDLEDKSNDYCVKINNSTDGTIATALVIDAEDTSSVFDDGILLTTTAGAITDGIDASDAGITNAINIGGNAIAGTNFSVNAAGVITATGLSLAVYSAGSNGSAGDFTFYSGTAGDYMMWDGSEKTLLFVDSNAHLQDNDELHFGAGSATGTGDFKVYSNGTNLYIAAVADVANQALYLGDDTNDLDVLWEGDTNAAIFQLDSSLNQAYLNGCTLRMGDSDKVLLGDGASNNGDFHVYSDGTHAYVQAVANTAGATLYLGDATNHLDVVWAGTTGSDVVTFGHDEDRVTFTDIDIVMAESATSSESLDITSAHTSVSAVEINSSGAIASDKASLAILATGALAAGGNMLRLDYQTGTPDAGSYMLELMGTSKDLIGIYCDVDTATNDAYTFHSGGATANTKSVVLVSADGEPAATANVLGVSFTGTATNYPHLLNLAGADKNVSGIYLDCDADGTNAYHLRIQDDKDTATGVTIYTHAESASPENADNILVWNFMGEDAGGTATEFGRLEVEIMTVTAGQEDGQFTFSAAAHNGSLTQIATVAPRAGGALGELTLGAGAGASYVTSKGAYSLILDTNNGGTGASVEIESGANSDVILTPTGTGEVKLAIGEITTVGTEDLVLDTNEGTNSGSITIADGADGAITIDPNGDGVTNIDNAAIRFATREIAGGTATDSPTNADGIIDIATNGAQALTVTLPEAADNLGLQLTFTLTTHGGQDATINRTGADVIDDAADLANTTITMEDAADAIVIQAVSANRWIVVKNIGCTLA